MLKSINSSYCWISLIAKKWKREILDYFQLFAVFIQIEKFRLFFLFSRFSLLSWQLSKHGTKIRSESWHSTILVFSQSITVKMGNCVEVKMNEVLNDESTSASSILVTPFLEQNKHKFLSKKPLRTPGKFCLNLFVCFHFTAYYVDITFKILHNVTRRQIQIRKRQTVQKCPSQIASISFSTIFWQLSIKKAELTQKAGKSQHFSILIKTSKSWKKTREMYCFDFFAISEIQR